VRYQASWLSWNSRAGGIRGNLCPMSIYDGVNQKLLEMLLDDVHAEVAGLPDFQRDYVWDPGATVNLIASVASDYPAGSILTVGNANNYFATRKFENAPDGGHMPKYLVLDGQQRLTSLYQAFFGAGDFRYYLDLKKFLEKEELLEEEVINFARANKKIAGKLFLDLMENDYLYQGQNRVLPLLHIFGPNKSFHKWAKSVEKALPVDEREEFSTQMDFVYETFVAKIEKYMFPVVSLSADTSVASLCTIFETLNRTGQKLTIFELLTARFWKDGINLRTLWDKAVEDYPVLTDYDVQAYQIIQGISMVTYPSASCKREDILNLKAEDINSRWDLVVESMAYGLEILRSDCMILNAKWLPTSGMLGPLAAVLAIGNSFPKSSKGVRRSQVVKWLWCSIFSQRYEAAANTRGAKDVNDLRNWFSDASEIPVSIAQFSFDSNVLRTVSSKGAGVYKGVICLSMKTNGGSLDFVTGAPIAHQLITSGEVDDHHIFPKSYLMNVKSIKDKTVINCVINRTLIDRETNKMISAKAPSDYVSNLKAPNLALVLDSHLIPSDLNGPLYRDDYESFLNARAELIAAKVNEVTSL
jgi:hypothetical protein